MYLYDYNNGLVEIGASEVEACFYTYDDYEISYTCPLCRGNGTVWASEVDDCDNEHEITCPHCGGDGECYDSIFIDIDVCETVETEGRKVGAYGDNDLCYSNNRVSDTVNEHGVYETIQRMIERQKEERKKSLTGEELQAIEREQAMKQALEKLMEEYQQAKAEAERILES